MMIPITRKRRRISTGYRKYASKGRFTPLQFVIVLIVIACATYVGANAGHNARATQSAFVTSVVDGDTIHVKFDDGHSETIRLLGIDTPETHHPTKPVQCFGPEAEQFTRTQLDQKNIRLEYDAEQFDKYKRTLAYVYLDNKMFNEELVDKGYARILSIAPNTKHAHELVGKELDAQQNNRGLWGYCTADN